jgi:gluconate 5-dehydrogenase
MTYITELFDLTGKRALITGSGQGIGFTIARGMARAGAMVILNDIIEERVNEAVVQLTRESLQAKGIVFDVRDEKLIDEQIRTIENDIGPLDVLVNNAGIQIRAPLEEFKLADWQKIIDINLTGVFLTARYAVQGMIKRKAGKIINICSIQSELARPTIAPYTASKGGVKLLTRGMATDWGKYNIQVNAIAPGYFKTVMTEKLYTDKDFDAWLCSRTPASRWGNPEELIGAAIFLASKASDYVNGHILFVDGGLMACV